MTEFDGPSRRPTIRETLDRLGVVFRMERSLLGLLSVYGAAIGLFSFIIPLTVQELVNTFAFGIQPNMVFTLAAIMLVILSVAGAFRVLQFYAVEILERRIFTRVALALAHVLPHFRLESFCARQANHFFETVLMQRALAALLVDVINVVVGAIVGMTILVVYHPYFLAYNMVLAAGGAAVVFWLGYGGLGATLDMSHAKYDTFRWMQVIADHLAHFKAAGMAPVIIEKTDALVTEYLRTRRARFQILLTQYAGSVGWQAFGHSALLATAGGLLSAGQLTLGQFVASEAIVGALLVKFDSVVKRMYVVFYFFTALTELDDLFSLPKDAVPAPPRGALPDPALVGVKLTCTNVTITSRIAGGALEPFNLDLDPGDKLAITSMTDVNLATVARVLAGAESPTNGAVQYNGIDVRKFDAETLSAYRALALWSQAGLFEGTLEENITLGRAGIADGDLTWALQFTELETDVNALPLGLRTPVDPLSAPFSTGQLLRILLARAIVTRPPLLILEGSLHATPPNTRDAMLRRLCDDKEPWSVVLVTHDPLVAAHAPRQLVLKPDSSLPLFRDRDTPGQK